MKKLLIVGLLLTSTAYAQKNDIHIEIENQGTRTFDAPYNYATNMSIVNFSFSHDFTDSVYSTMTFSTGSGQTITRSSHYYDETPHRYSAVKMGIGFRF